SDLWLAASFAAFERYAEREKALLESKLEGKRKGKAKGAEKSGTLSEKERDELSLLLFRARADFLAASRALGEPTPLSSLKPGVASSDWHRIARGRGVLLLNDLRRRLGSEGADALFDSFGRDHGGKAARTEDLITAAEKMTGESLMRYFEPWLEKTDLPRLSLDGFKVEKCEGQPEGGSSPEGEAYSVSGKVQAEGDPAPSRIEVTVETEDGEATETFPVEAGQASFRLGLEKRPTRLVVDKYAAAAR